MFLKASLDVVLGCQFGQAKKLLKAADKGSGNVVAEVNCLIMTKMALSASGQAAGERPFRDLRSRFRRRQVPCCSSPCRAFPILADPYLSAAAGSLRRLLCGQQLPAQGGRCVVFTNNNKNQKNTVHCTPMVPQRARLLPSPSAQPAFSSRSPI